MADSIVGKARETLESAIDYVRNEEKWGAKVIYGDTDRWVCGASGQFSGLYLDLRCGP